MAEPHWRVGVRGSVFFTVMLPAVFVLFNLCDTIVGEGGKLKLFYFFIYKYNIYYLIFNFIEQEMLVSFIKLDVCVLVVVFFFNEIHVPANVFEKKKHV
jgi:hypothetical protein